MEKISIAIDGPAAAGKSTVAKIIAKKLNLIYVDTGAMYRSLTYEAIRNNVDVNDEDGLINLLKGIDIRLEQSKNGQAVFINGENVTEEIRTNEVTNQVAFVSKHRKVREEMTKRQQQIGQNGGVVMDGRDIGTHVLPHAEVKIFLLASVEERAKRRHLENLEKGHPSDLEKLKQEIADRDKRDSEREVAPLKKASDAVEIDTTSKTIDEVVEDILTIVRERIG